MFAMNTQIQVLIIKAAAAESFEKGNCRI